MKATGSPDGQRGVPVCRLDLQQGGNKPFSIALFLVKPEHGMVNFYFPRGMCLFVSLIPGVIHLMELMLVCSVVLISASGQNER